MSALQSHYSDRCFQRMRLMTAYGTEFFSMNDVKRLRIIQDIIDRRLTTRLAASRLEKSDRHYQRLLERYHEQGHFHLLTGGVARLVWPCHERIEHHRYLCQYQFIQGPCLRSRHAMISTFIVRSRVMKIW